MYDNANTVDYSSK